MAYMFLGLSSCAVLYSLLAIPIISMVKLCGILKTDSFHANLTGKVAIVTGANTGETKAPADLSLNFVIICVFQESGSQQLICWLRTGPPLLSLAGHWRGPTKR